MTNEPLAIGLSDDAGRVRRVLVGVGSRDNLVVRVLLVIPGVGLGSEYIDASVTARARPCHVTGEALAGDGVSFSRAGLETGSRFKSGPERTEATCQGVSIHAAARTENRLLAGGADGRDTLNTGQLASDGGKTAASNGDWISIGDAAVRVIK